ncbi:MAG: deoxyguanosinetriphosphate triphosphohydrolase [Butyrivibrio sp.]|nr:deoxyguanosinetriphosphate triphosphohydrolase [Butyrivibrio sp.]
MEWSQLLSSSRMGGKIEESYKESEFKRSEFERDYSRIVSSASFRRLQDKTQVFPLDSSDFVRTRLTHSLEVASIAKELGKAVEYYLIENKLAEAEVASNISDILMCAGLLHDIGNPPFGHFGETVIGDWYKKNGSKITFCEDTLETAFGKMSPKYQDLCNFEGNAQAFRLLSKLHFVDNDCGMNLTNAVLNTIIKYPCSSTQKDKDHVDIKYHKMGYFQGDLKNFEKITTDTGTRHNDIVCRHPLTYLLEAADDIAYATADLEDGYKKGIFTLDELIAFIEEQRKVYDCKMNDYQKKFTKELFEKLGKYREQIPENIQKNVKNRDLYAMQNWIGYVRGWFVYCACFGFKQKYNLIMAGNCQNEIMAETNHEFSLKILKDAMGKFIYPQPRILKLELAADSIISTLLDKFVTAVRYYDYICPEELDEEKKKQRMPGKGDEKIIKLLSDNYLENYKLEVKDISDEKEKLYHRLLLVNDFISGMTDTYAKSLYQELNGIY